jgi:hypothetical protein
MLNLARQEFAKSGDTLQELMALTVLALAYFRAGDVEHVRPIIKRLEVVGSADMRGWSLVQSIVADASAVRGVEGHPRQRLPWLYRSALALALARDEGRSGSRTRGVIDVWHRILTRPQLPAEARFAERPQANVGATQHSAFERLTDAMCTIRCVERAKGSLLEAVRVRIEQPGGRRPVEITAPRHTTPYREAAGEYSRRMFPDVSRLNVDQFAAWVNWESIFDPSGETMYSRRVNTDESLAPKLVQWESPTFYTVTLDHAGADMAGSAISRIRGDGEVRWSYSYNTDDLQDLGPGIQVMHFITDVLEISGGARLSLRSDNLERGRGRVLRPEELPRLRPDIRVFILQPSLLQGGTYRGPLEREKAALMRAFAAELQLVSRAIVITLPALAFNYAIEMLTAVGRGVLNPEPTAAMSIYEHLKDARAELFRRLAETPHDEAPFDICYFG